MYSIGWALKAGLRRSVSNINIAFYLLVVIGIVLLWFALAFLFKPIGKLFSRLWEDAKREMSSGDKEI